MDIPNVVTIEKQITLEEWKQMVAKGNNISTKIYTLGASMFPLLRAEGDSVTIIPLQRQLNRGDVVVFLRTDGKCVAHRVCWYDENTVKTIGDNCERFDKVIHLSEILGLVTYVHRGGKDIFVDNSLWRFYGRVMQWIMPARKLFKKVRSRIYRMVKKKK